MMMSLLSQVLQTSSPSYLLLASLDAARHQAFQPETWTGPVAAAAAARAGLTAMSGIMLLEEGSTGVQSSIAGFDPLRLVVNVEGLGLTGYKAAEWVEQRHGVVPEMATDKVGGGLGGVMGGGGVARGGGSFWGGG